MSAYGLNINMESTAVSARLFWEKYATYTCKNLSENYFYRDESEKIFDLMVKRLVPGSFILNTGSGYPRPLIDLLLATGKKCYLLNIDIASKVIDKADGYCRQAGFDEEGRIYTKKLLTVENIKADFAGLTNLAHRAKIKNRIKKDYDSIVILALNSLQNAYIPGDEGLNSLLKMITFFTFGDAFFVTMLDYHMIRARIAYYLRNLKGFNRIQLRNTSFDGDKLDYGEKTEFSRSSKELDQLVNKMESSGTTGERAVVIDTLDANCQHTGYRTVLMNVDFAMKFFGKALPDFQLDLCGYPQINPPLSPVLLPVAGKKT